jgi:DNA-binding NtrC family response regulator
MRARVQALLVHDEEGTWAELTALLQKHGLQTTQARNCAEAQVALRIHPPSLIFTDAVLQDGTWAGIQALAKGAARAMPVIVVSWFVDIPLYLDVLEKGAADFIVPPFRGEDIAYVVKGALLSSSRIASGLSRTTGTRSNSIEHAQNHSDSELPAAHAQT